MSEQPVAAPQQPYQPTPADLDRANRVIMALREELGQANDKVIMKSVEVGELTDQLEQERGFRINMAAEIKRLKDAYEPDPPAEETAPPEGVAIPVEIPPGEPSPLEGVEQ